MKKMLFALVALLIATPAFAAVTITCNQPTPGNGLVDINYSVDDANDLAKAFALNVQVSAGTISAVNNANAKYRIYPGSIVISDGVVTNWGTPVASGTGALGGIGTSGVTLEMGALYKMSDANDANKPATSGLLCSITVSALPCTVNITGNATRGNVVFESGATTDPNSSCQALGGSTCWDASECAGQPYGDANCDGNVNFADLARIKTAWLKNKGDTGYDCGPDFNHDNSINFADLAILKVNWLHTPAYTPSTGNQTCPP